MLIPAPHYCPQVFRFTHWLDEKAEFKCSFKNGAASAFEVLPTVAGPAPSGQQGQEVAVEVHFEPTALGENIRDTLIITSAAAGAGGVGQQLKLGSFGQCWLMRYLCLKKADRLPVLKQGYAQVIIA